jgi:hypothetical protein
MRMGMIGRECRSDGNQDTEGRWGRRICIRSPLTRWTRWEQARTVGMADLSGLLVFFIYIRPARIVFHRVLLR